MPLTKTQVAKLRAAIIAGPGDAVLSPEEAAAVMDVSLSWLRRSDVPVARKDVGGVKYLKSECLKYVATRLSHRIAS
jgi:hypothetical protein